MNNEKIKKIKKDIEICMKSLNCNGCSHHSQRSGECCRNLTNDILTYINELERENERLNNLREVVAPIYVMPNVETPEMMLKLGEKNLLQQFAKWLKDDIEQYHGNYGDLSYSECAHIIDERLKWFIGEKFDNEVEE